MFLLTFKFQPEDVACQYCTRYKVCRQQQDTCPWLRERLEAGVVSYAELMLSLLDTPNCPIDCRRLTELLESYPGSLWNSESHQINYRWLESNIPLGRADTNRRLASAYLLSATPKLIQFSKSCCMSGSHSRHSATNTENLSDSELTMLVAAFNLLTQPKLPPLGSLLSPDRADLFSTRHIANALLIAKFGPDVLKVQD
jgi:hypothetical protein